MGERESLIARIRQIRGAPEPSGEAAEPRHANPEYLIRALEERITHLEQLLQGLQDSVHRDAVRQDRRVAELEARIQPAALSRALSTDARERGL